MIDAIYLFIYLHIHLSVCQLEVDSTDIFTHGQSMQDFEDTCEQPDH